MGFYVLKLDRYLSTFLRIFYPYHCRCKARCRFNECCNAHNDDDGSVRICCNLQSYLLLHKIGTIFRSTVTRSISDCAIAKVFCKCSCKMKDFERINDFVHYYYPVKKWEIGRFQRCQLCDRTNDFCSMYSIKIIFFKLTEFYDIKLVCYCNSQSFRFIVVTYSLFSINLAYNLQSIAKVEILSEKVSTRGKNNEYCICISILHPTTLVINT